MSKTTRNALLAAAAAASKGKTVRIEVDEFSPEGEPPVVVYGKVPTIKDRSNIHEAATDAITGRTDPFEAAVRTVILLALDEQGERLFTLENAQSLRVNVPADLIEGLAARLNAGLSYEPSKKKSERTQSSDTA